MAGIHRFYWIVLFAVLASGTLIASSQNAVIYGSVYDRTGNPLSGATVILSNSALGFMRSATTGPDGTYEISEVPPAAEYRLSASKDGKVIEVRSGITLNVGDERVVLPPLREQAVSAGAERTKSGPADASVTNDVVSTAISGVISGSQLRSLPLYNRNFLALGLLTPNTREVEAGNPLSGASFSIAGARPASNNFLLDGSDNVAASSNQAIPFQVNDAIQEFRVTSANASAEYGRNQGGVVNVITRRGTNSFHGSAFGYLGSDRLNAQNALSVYNGTTFDQAAAYAGSLIPEAPDSRPRTYNSYVDTAQAAGFCTDGLPVICNNTRFSPGQIRATEDSRFQPYSSQQFGINSGGALIRDRLFVFGSYEGTRIDNPNPIFERVPSSFDKTYDPLQSGILGFPSGDANFALAQSILALYPKANVVGVPGVLEFFRGTAPNFTNVNNGLLRFDYGQSDRSTWTGRYAVQQLHQLHDDSLPEQSNYPGNGAFRDAFNQNAILVYSHNFSPKLILDAKAGFSRFQVEETAQDQGFNATSIGLPAPPLMTFLLSGLDTQYSGATNAAGGGQNGAFGGWADTFLSNSNSVMLPSLDGLFPLARIGAPLYAPSLQKDSTWSWGSGISWNHGRHSTKAGLDGRFLINRVFNGAFSRGLVVSSDIGEFTHDSETCNQNCGTAFLAPSFDYALRQSSPYLGDFHSYAYSGFAQDTWRLRPRLTLNGGLRYEYFSPPVETENRIWNFDPVANGLVQQNGSQVMDPFGNVCDTSTMSFPYDAVYADVGTTSPWRCNPQGTGKIANDYHNNVAPRLGIAWDLLGGGRTVLRGGLGWYYDQIPVNDVAQLLFNRPTPLVPNSPQAIYGQNSGGSFCLQCGFGNSTLNPNNLVLQGTQNFQSASSPFAMYARDFNNSATPYSRQINLSVQQQLTGKMNIEIGYVGISGKRLPIVVNAGFLNQWFCLSTPGCDNNSFFPVFTLTNQAQSSYHSAMARLQVTQWHGLQMHAAYSFSKSLDNASNAGFPLIPSTLFNQVSFQLRGSGNPSLDCLIFDMRCGGRSLGNSTSVVGAVTALTTTGSGQILVSPYLVPQDPTNFLRDDYGPSDFNSTHRGVLDLVWDIPAPQRSLFLGGWQISSIFQSGSGQPFTIFAGPLFGELTQRVNITGSVQFDDQSGDPLGVAGFGLASAQCGFVTGAKVFGGRPGKPCTGNSGRNAFVGPMYTTLDSALQKRISLGEARACVLRAEMYNVLNHTNLYNPISALSLDGLSINPEFGQFKSSHQPRRMQLAARFVW